jgi:CheY-like chemotaxis protein
MMRRKILCIDDYPPLAELCGILSDEIGYDFVIETDAGKALNTFSERPEVFAAAVVDQLMTPMAGEELAKHLVRIRPDIPIILSTGDPQNVPKGLDELGIRAILRRPSTKQDFADAIAKVLV